MFDSVAFGPISAAVVTHGPQSPDTAVLLYASGGTWTQEIHHHKNLEQDQELEPKQQVLLWVKVQL